MTGTELEDGLLLRAGGHTMEMRAKRETEKCLDPTDSPCGFRMAYRRPDDTSDSRWFCLCGYALKPTEGE